ncbi:MAG: GFA family protein [Proteobacteria bacterium]|nr:GFA family protein [Pseudomonadota bacterium]MDA0993645.1 GFA family protein [Pseudomonadota bacterium]
MSTKQTVNAGGSCLCGGVKYEVTGALRPIVYCHCDQCRKTSGHFVASTACSPEQLVLRADEDLRWYRSSASAQRGFCQRCGSSLFWRPEGKPYICIMAGTLTRPTALSASAHIYVHMASDYYSIDDGLPQYEDDYPATLTGISA